MVKSKHILKIVVLLFILGLTFAATGTLAQTLNIDYPPLRIPGGIFDINDAYASGKVGLRQLIILFYVLTLWAAGVLAFVLLIYAGLVYIISGGNPGKRRAAFQKFKNIWIGVAVLLFSWFFLNILNPGIVNLDLYVFLSTTDSGKSFDENLLTKAGGPKGHTADEAGTFTCQWSGGGCIAGINNCKDGFVPACGDINDMDFCTEAQDEGQPFVCVEAPETATPPSTNPGADGINVTERASLSSNCTSSGGVEGTGTDTLGNTFTTCTWAGLTEALEQNWCNMCLNNFLGHECGILNDSEPTKVYCGYLTG